MIAPTEKPASIIITRPEPDATALADRVRALGMTPVMSPAMKIDFFTAPVDLNGIDALAFTSANGVRAFARNHRARDIPTFAVGPATAAQAAQEGFDTIHVAGGDVEALVELIASVGVNGAVLHVAGAVVAGDLSTALQSHSIPTKRIVLYRSRETALLSDDAVSAIANADENLWIALFSPRTAGIFVKQIQNQHLEDRLKTVSAACLSRAVEKQLAPLNMKKRLVAEKNTTEALLSLITRH